MSPHTPIPSDSLTTLLSQYISHHKLPSLNNAASPHSQSLMANISANYTHLIRLRALLVHVASVHDIILEMEQYDMHQRHGSLLASSSTKSAKTTSDASNFAERMRLLARLKGALAQFDAIIADMDLNAADFVLKREFERAYERGKRDLERESTRLMERLFEVKREEAGMKIILPRHHDAFMVHLFENKNIYWSNILERFTRDLGEVMKEHFERHGKIVVDVYDTDADRVVEIVLSGEAQSPKDAKKHFTQNHHIDLDIMRSNLGMLSRLVETFVSYIPTSNAALRESFLESVISPVLGTGFESIVDWQICHMEVHDTQKQQQFHALVEEFINRLRSVCDADDNTVDALPAIDEQYVQHTAEVCTRKRCMFSLRYSRRALLENYSKSVEEGSLASNPQSLFYFPRCSVSKGVQTLTKECERLFREAFPGYDASETRTQTETTPLPDECTKILLACVMDSLHLFRILIPSTYTRQFINIQNTQQCMEFYCNCMYLAHHISLIHYTYHSAHSLVSQLKLPSFAAEIKDLGAKYFQQQYCAQEQDLRAIIRSIKGLHDISSNYDRVEQKIHQLTKKLSNLAVHLKPLPQAMYVTTFGTLVSLCMALLSEEILKVNDIGADECQLIQQLLQPLADFAQDWFGVAEVQQLVPSFARFQSIIHILSLPLVEIAPKFHLGHLGGLSSEDVVHMIKALFSSTLKRSQAIYDVQNGSGGGVE